jgi:predicted O-methyltransferase YrrM
MLELIGTEEWRTVSKPSEVVLRWLDKKIDLFESVRVAEIGVGIGATTLELARKMKNSGELCVFDYADRANELLQDLKELGFNNVTAYTNSEKHWDSYHWSLSKMIREHQQETFDLIYIDGAHTYLHDALAFFLCDRLLKVGGVMIFDDWYWAYANSKWMADVRDDFMTEEQAKSLQIKMLIEDLIRPHVGYREVERLEVFQKIASTTRAADVTSTA